MATPEVVRPDNRFQVDQDIAFQRRDWIFERIGWGALFLVVAAAAAGYLGRGRASERVAETADRSARVEYGRFERHGAPARLIVTVQRPQPRDTLVSIWIDDPFLDGVRMTQVTPEPVSQRSDARRTTFAFALSGGADRARVVFHFTPDALWAREAQVGVLGGAELRLNQFIFP
jgi:hypothetical protein